jgi:hypothetical protein
MAVVQFSKAGENIIPREWINACEKTIILIIGEDNCCHMHSGVIMNIDIVLRWVERDILIPSKPSQTAI